jgi:hypothetical protein
VWPEFSSAIALACVRAAQTTGRLPAGPVVAIQTSAGFKDPTGPRNLVPGIEPTVPAMLQAMRDLYGIQIG